MGERKVKVKRVRMNVVAEWSAPTQKHKLEKQQRSPIMNKGNFNTAIIATFLYSIYIFILFSLDLNTEAHTVLQTSVLKQGFE